MCFVHPILSIMGSRRKHKEDTEYERHLAQAMQHTQRQAMQGIVGAYSGGGGGGAGIVGKPLHQTWLDDYLSTGSITAAQPEPKLKPYDKIKKALGI